MTAALIGLIVVFALIFMGLPIAIAMGLVGFIGYAWLTGMEPASVVFAQVVVDTAASEALSVLPLFILMGNFINRAGLSTKLYDASNAFVGHWRGGLSLATIMACGGFSAVCGSSLATAATMGKIAMPSMRRFGYADSLAAGSIAAGGTLGILIPPSTIMIIYGTLTETDIGKLFVAGIIPGLIGVLFYMVTVFLILWRDPWKGPAGDRYSWRHRIRAMRGIWGVLLLFALVMGGIYLGVFTPTEAAGIGAAGAFIFAIGARQLKLRQLVPVLVETARTTAALLAVLMGALMFSQFVNVAGLPRALIDGIGGLDVVPVVVIFIIIGMFLMLGAVLESLAMLLLMVPMLFDLVTGSPATGGLGYDPIWFGVIVVVAIEISMITPPIGINVFVLKSVLRDVRTGDIFKGVAPFVLAGIARIVLLAMIPVITLWLPSLM